MDEKEYAGFWIRLGATLIDSLMFFLIIVGVILVVYKGKPPENEAIIINDFWNIFFNYIFPAIATLLFWFSKAATPGKMATKLTIVDAKTGGKPSNWQFIGRYFAYFISGLACLIGFIWVGVDKKKQGWHDKMAGTVVIRTRASEPVTFAEKDVEQVEDKL